MLKRTLGTIEADLSTRVRIQAYWACSRKFEVFVGWTERCQPLLSDSRLSKLTQETILEMVNITESFACLPTTWHEGELASHRAKPWQNGEIQALKMMLEGEMEVIVPYESQICIYLYLIQMASTWVYLILDRVEGQVEHLSKNAVTTKVYTITNLRERRKPVEITNQLPPISTDHRIKGIFEEETSHEGYSRDELEDFYVSSQIGFSKSPKTCDPEFFEDMKQVSAFTSFLIVYRYDEQLLEDSKSGDLSLGRGIEVFLKKGELPPEYLKTLVQFGLDMEQNVTRLELIWGTFLFVRSLKDKLLIGILKTE